MKRLRLVGVVLAVLILGIQLVPVDRENPPVTADFDGPDDVKTVLKAACYNCHSNETAWPWYAYVAPVKFLVADHVKEGRRQFNLSEWGSYPEDTRTHLRHEMWEEVEEGHMPLPDYVRMHPEAVLDEGQKATLREWAEEGPEEEASESDDDHGSHEHSHEGDHD